MRPLLLLVLLTFMPACSGGSSTLTIQSESAVITPSVLTALYRYTDQNTADIYLSDFPAETIVERLGGVEGPPGTVLHLHVFLAPKAGRTPIDFTASNAAATYIVFSGNAMGVYGGGGFVLPSSRIGDSEFEARMRQATVRIVEHSAGFADRLGNAEVSGDISARRDDERAGQVSDALTRLLLEFGASLK